MRWHDTDKKIKKVLARLARKEKAERRKGKAIPHRQRIQAITPRIGRFYSILLRTANVASILEIGTSSGYSTIWFAEVLRKVPKSKIITIENNPEKIQLARRNFEESGIAEKIEIRHGDALEVLSQISHMGKKFDFIFIDADKERYIQYFDAGLQLLRVGGLICADNILYPKRFSKMMRAYLRHVKNTSNVISVTIPIDNGEEVTVKLGP